MKTFQRYLSSINKGSIVEVLGLPAAVLDLRIGSCLACVYRVMDARGKFGEHERSVKARLHRRFLSRQLDAIFVAPKLHQVSNMFETPAISH